MAEPKHDLLCAGRRLALTDPCVMGILNVTPDSFSDGGALYRDGRLDRDFALRHAAQMVADGAAIIDVGGESTRPGAEPVSPQEEMDRVLPVVEAIASRFDVIVSVDSSQPALMLEAAALGAGLLNDVRAFALPGAAQAAAATGLPLCLMHMQGEPRSMQSAPQYRDVVSEVCAYLSERVEELARLGVARRNMLLDPGFGFGKTLDHNLQLLQGLPELAELGHPLLVGLSRKSMIGQLLGRPVEQRLAASLALAVLAMQRGASILRVHDVRETVDAVAMFSAVNTITR